MWRCGPRLPCSRANGPSSAPPGALPEAEFPRTCIRCGECMKILRDQHPPALPVGVGPDRPLDSETRVPRLAACEPNCNVCGTGLPDPGDPLADAGGKEPCEAGNGRPAQGIVPRLVAEQAVPDLRRDLPLQRHRVSHPSTDYRRPFVVASRCNGCGYCEQRCPVKGESAIVVICRRRDPPHGGLLCRRGKEAPTWSSRPTPVTTNSSSKSPGFSLDKGRIQGKLIHPTINQGEKAVPAASGERPDPGSPRAFCEGCFLAQIVPSGTGVDPSLDLHGSTWRAAIRLRLKLK